MRSFPITDLRPEDWPQASLIYAQGIATGVATFETTVPDWEHFSAAHHPFCRLAVRSGNELAGWAALGPISKREVYAGVAEVSIYVGEVWRGHGIGRALLEHLILCSELHQIWTLQASIFAKNDASLQLHLDCGFRQVGKRIRIAQLNDIWHDTVLLERRSDVVGVD